MHNKILYLDFDGVLHPTSLGIESFFCKASLLDALISQHAVSLVISSSWRFTHSLSELQSKLPQSLAKNVIGTTGGPAVGKFARYREIQNHLSNQVVSTDWRALDDSYWEFPSNCKELIRCNPNTGITPKEIKLLSSWLSK